MGVPKFRDFVALVMKRPCFERIQQNVCFDRTDLSSFLADVVLPTLEAARRSSAPPLVVSPKSGRRLGLYMDMASYMYGAILKQLEESDEGKLFAAAGGKTACDLSPALVDKISTVCCGRVCDRYAELLFVAHRLSFAWDTDAPTAKLYEQTKRRLAARVSVSRASRTACYRETVRKVRRVIVERYMANLKRFDIPDDAVAAAAIERCVDYQMGTAGDQAFAVGEGEWKCFYQIIEDAENGVVDAAEVFGNDWDIGLAAVLHDRPNTAVYYRCKPDELFSMSYAPPLDGTRKAFYFMALSALGNDYIFPLVGDSVTNLRAIAKCCSYVEDGGLHFGAGLATFLNGGGGGGGDRRLFSRCFAEVLTALLLAVYTGHDNGAVSRVLWYERERAEAAAGGECPIRRRLFDARSDAGRPAVHAAPPSPPVKRARKGSDERTVYDENTLITCRASDGSRHARTLLDVVDSYVTSTLWYASYCVFYGVIDERARHAFKNGLDGCKDTVMDIGMPMERPFTYGDERVSRERFEIRSLLELKRIVKNITPCLLFWIVENSVAHLCGRDEEKRATVEEEASASAVPLDRPTKE